MCGCAARCACCSVNNTMAPALCSADTPANKSPCHTCITNMSMHVRCSTLFPIQYCDRMTQDLHLSLGPPLSHPSDGSHRSPTCPAATAPPRASCQVLGYVCADSLPRYQLMGECWVLMGDAGVLGAQQAVSALARALHSKGQAGGECVCTWVCVRGVCSGDAQRPMGHSMATRPLACTRVYVYVGRWLIQRYRSRLYLSFAA